MNLKKELIYFILCFSHKTGLTKKKVFPVSALTLKIFNSFNIFFTNTMRVYLRDFSSRIHTKFKTFQDKPLSKLEPCILI